MIVGLVVVFGLVVGLISNNIYGSGYGQWWDICLGIAGSVIGNCIMTAAYLLNYVGRANIIGLNWHSITITVLGAFAVIYGGLLFKKINPRLQIEKLILPRRIRPA